MTPCAPYPDEDHHEHGRSRGELGEGIAVEELPRGHPVKSVDDLPLHLGHDPEAPAHADGGEPEKGPAEPRQVGDHEDGRRGR